MNRTDLVVKYVGIAAFLVLCLSSSPHLARAQGRSSIGGMVVDGQRQPVRDIPVELLNDTNSVIQRTKTDGSGRYFFRGVPSGRFAIKVMPLGTNLEEQIQDIEIAGIGADGRQLADNVQADFQLRSRRNFSAGLEVKGVIFAEEVPDAARKLYETAISDLDTNKIDAGVSALEKAIVLFPNYYSALARLGFVYIEQQKFQQAKEVLTKAVSVNDRSFAGWYGISYAGYVLNEPEQSLTAAQKALVLNKTSVNTLFLLGLVQRRLKNFDESEKSLLQAKKLDNGRTPDINWNLALLYAQNLARYKDAANELEAYLRIIPDAPNRDGVKKLIKKFRETPPAP